MDRRPLPPLRQGTGRSVGRRGPLAAAAVLLGGLLLAAASLVAAPAGAQDPSFGPVDTTTTLPGGLTPTTAATTVAGDDPAASTTEGPEVKQPATSDSTRILTESRKIMAIVGGLVVIALLLTLLTIRYWRQTRPVAPAEPPARHAKPPSDRAARRAAAAQAVEAEPVFADAAVGRGSRRAVAGADHAGADADWEPRHTGEQERVVLPPAPGRTPGADRPARPSRSGRAAALRRPDGT